MPKSKNATMRSLAEHLADLDDPAPKDFDPEDLDPEFLESSDESGSGIDDEKASREHYQAVGRLMENRKGKLRRPETIELPKEYAGSRVSRNAAVGNESDDDPFKELPGGDDDDQDEEYGLDGEDVDVEDMDNGSIEEEDTHDRSSDGESQDMDDEENFEEFSDGEDDIGSEASSSGSDASSQPNEKPLSDERAELRRLMATDQKTVAATISKAAKADAAKGKAVKQQRSTFDALLNTRIRLQKGLTAINDVVATAGNLSVPDSETIQSAESAALVLWSTLEDLRLTLADVVSKDSSKRKRPASVSLTTSTESLWKRMIDFEQESLSHRRAVLDKWSLKVRGPAALPSQSRGKLLGSSNAKQGITAILDAHIATEISERTSKRPRSAKTTNVEPKDTLMEPLYDDTAFYQSLLRDLVEQRMSSSDAVTNGIDALHLQLPTHKASGMRKDKIQKVVDTKASKGRKLRYNVQEKLQNFMAPEDRGTWSARAREEFFASLLGRTASGLLGEDDGPEEGMSDEDSEGLGFDGGDSALKLFRT